MSPEDDVRLVAHWLLELRALPPGKLTAWEDDFTTQMQDQFERQGTDRMTKKQRACLEKIYEERTS